MTIEERLTLAEKALLALAAGAHREHYVDPKWVVATALHGLGVQRPEGPLSAFIKTGRE